MHNLVLKKVELSISNMTEESVSYLVSVLTFLLLSIFLKIFGDSISPQFFWVPLAILIYGFLRFVLEALQPWWNTLAGKLFISATLFIGSSVCFTFAKVLINQTLEVPASTFLYTQSLVALFISPIVISIFLGFSLVFTLPFSMIFIFFGKPGSLKQLVLFWKGGLPEMKKPFIKFSRFLALIALMSVCWSFNSQNNWYISPIQNFAKWYAYSFESELFSYCTTNAGEKVAYINKDDIVLAKKAGDDYVFNIAICERKL